MKHLILKDVKVLTIANMTMPIVWWLLSYNVKVRGNTFYAKTLFYSFFFITIFVISLLLTRYDENSNIDIILNSLPIDRRLIVRARYISIALYTVFISLGFFIVFNLTFTRFARIFGSVSASFLDMLFIIGLALIFYSFYLPFHYLSLGKAYTFIQIFVAILILLPVLILKYGERLLSIDLINTLFNTGFRNLVFILLGLGIVLYLLSLQLTKLIYNSKEFY
ncbi:MAG: ABC-2 transporter permease [Tissierellia bacterium]|nr:ABC-2 transporter permease [Tissierellia bacterium]